MKLVYSYQITICKFRMDALVLSYNTVLSQLVSLLGQVCRNFEVKDVSES